MVTAANENVVRYTFRGRDQTGQAFSSVNRKLKATKQNFQSLGRAMVGAAAAGAVFGGSFAAIAKAGGDLERRQLRINALIRSTGRSATLTAGAVDEMAKSIGRATLQSREGALDAASALLTFRSVGTEAFERTLSLAADISEVMGTDMRSAALQLGKVLENPVSQMGALTRAGITFSDAQKEIITDLVETNRLLDAQSMILETIEGQVGGAGAAAGKGIAGAFDELAESVRDFFTALGQTRPFQMFAEMIRRLARLVDRAAERIAPSGVSIDVTRGQTVGLPTGRGPRRLARPVPLPKPRPEYFAEMAKTAEMVKEIWTDTFTDIASGFGDWTASLITDITSVQDALESLGKTALKIAQNLLSNIITRRLGAGLGTLSPPSFLMNAFGFHKGSASVPSGGQSRTVSAGVFAGAPRLHNGNLNYDEYPAILQRGETVTPANQSLVNINIIDQTSGRVDVQTERSNGGRDVSVILRDQVRADISNGEFDSALNRRYGVRAAGTEFA